VSLRRRGLAILMRGVGVCYDRMAPSRRQHAVVETARTALSRSSPEERAALHHALDRLGSTWPRSRKLEEAHVVGLYAAVAETASVPGSVVECGVGHGGSLVALARANELFSPDRRVIGFDSFRGFSPGAPQDVGPRVHTPGKVVSGWDDTSVSLIDALLDAPAELVPGYFAETLQGGLPLEISLLHVDCDLYEPTHLVLQLGLPRLSTGGMVIFDEYDQTRWPGSTTATDEVLANYGMEPAWDPLLARHVLRVTAPLVQLIEQAAGP
jgi:hypothetical protein